MLVVPSLFVLDLAVLGRAVAVSEQNSCADVWQQTDTLQLLLLQSAAPTAAQCNAGCACSHIT